MKPSTVFLGDKEIKGVLPSVIPITVVSIERW